MNKKSVLWTVLFLALSATSAWASDQERIRSNWQSLDKTQNQCPQVFDYFPRGGMRIFYCHMQTLTDYKQLGELVGMPIFLKGPHTALALKLDAKTSFGHYNPDFVHWLQANLIPGATDPAFRAATQPLYHQYVQDLARTYYAVYRLLQAQPTFRDQARADYQIYIAGQGIPDFYIDGYYEFGQLHNHGYNGNVVKTGVLFWLRRNIDGTDSAFFSGLNKLLRSYDSEFIQGFRTTDYTFDKPRLVP